jgi:hypothetical protein
MPSIPTSAYTPFGPIPGPIKVNITTMSAIICREMIAFVVVFMIGYRRPAQSWKPLLYQVAEVSTRRGLDSDRHLLLTGK